MTRDEFIDNLNKLESAAYSQACVDDYWGAESAIALSRSQLLAEYDRLQAEVERLSSELTIRKYDGTTFTVRKEAE